MKKIVSYSAVQPTVEDNNVLSVAGVVNAVSFGISQVTQFVQSYFQTPVNPVFLAFENDDEDAIKQFINDRTFNVNDDETIREFDGFPIFWAIENDKFNLVKLLVENGANVNVLNWFGRTPLEVAGSSELREYLSENGALGLADIQGRQKFPETRDIVSRVVDKPYAEGHMLYVSFDWKSEIYEIVDACNMFLLEGDLIELVDRDTPFPTAIKFESREILLPYNEDNPVKELDEVVMLINQLVSSKYELRDFRKTDGDTYYFLLLTHQEWDFVDRNHSDWSEDMWWKFPDASVEALAGHV